MPDDARSPEDDLLRSWRANAAAWTQAVRAGRIASRQQGTNRAILDAVAACAPERVLDVGCGEGWLVHALTAQGYQATGVDGCRPLVDAARAGPGTFLACTYAEIVADPRRLGAAYDAVVCNFSLLGEAVGPLLEALGTRLRPGGHLLLQTVHPLTQPPPYRDGWRVERFEAFGEDFAAPMPWYFRTLGAWVAVLRGAGYTLTQCLEPPGPDADAPPLSLLLVAQRR